MEHRQHSSLSKSRTTSRTSFVAIFFICLAAIVTASIAYFGLMKAKVTVVRKEFPITKTFEVVIADIATNDEEVQGSVFEDTDTFTATAEDFGTPSAVQGRSEGTIRVINNWTSVQPLQATTRFLTDDGILFRSIERVDVPPGGEATVQVKADTEGISGDVPKDTHFTIPGLWKGLQDKIYGVASDDFQGGTRSVALVSEDDIARVKQLAYQGLDTKMQTKHTSTDPTRYIYVSQTKVLSNSVSASAGDTAETLTYSAKATYAVISLSTEQFNLFLYKTLGNLLTDDEKISRIDLASVTCQILTSDSEKKKWAATCSATGYGKLSEQSPALSTEIFTNQSQEQLDAYAEEQIGIASIRATFFPFWAQRTPALSSRISVSIE